MILHERKFIYYRPLRRCYNKDYDYGIVRFCFCRPICLYVHEGNSENPQIYIVSSPIKALSSVLVGLATQLGLTLQCHRRVELIHHDFDELDLLSACKSRIVQESGKLLLVVDGIGLGLAAVGVAEDL
jgi:hypothetical protein